MWDWRVGKVANPTVELAVAVGASSAFPPVLSPARLKLKDSEFAPGTGADLQRPPFTEDVFLTDGGVYDNLGLETAWKEYDTIFVSDGGANLAPEPEPHTDWVRHAFRINDVMDNQVRSLRTRQVIASYETGERKGAYWGVRTDIAEYRLADALSCPHQATLKLAEMPTRLAKVEPELQEQIINWGYAVCDAAMRRHVDSTLPPAHGFPYPGGVG
jgi:NTE family protein